MKRMVLAASIAAVFATGAAAQSSGVPVLVHYCNWHGKFGTSSSWIDGTTLPTYSDGYCVPDPRFPSKFDCFTGYQSLDAKTIAHHNEQFADNGLVPLTSWWGKVGEPTERSGDLFLDLYFSVPSPVQTGILYEVVGRLEKSAIGTLPDGRPWEVYDFGDSAESENARRFIADVKYLNEKYWQRYPERAFRIDGKPVLFIWLSHAFWGRFDLAAAELRKDVPVYIIGSDFGIYPPNDHNPLLATVRGLDAVSAYSIYDGDRTKKYRGHLSAQWVQEYAMAVLAWNAWLREKVPHVRFIPPTTFTYHDSRGNPILDRTTPAEAQHLATTVRSLIDQGRAGCTQVLPYVLHVSWNEHYEGTSVEPSVQNRLVFEPKEGPMGADYGTSFLDILRTTFKERPLLPAPRCQ